MAGSRWESKPSCEAIALPLHEQWTCNYQPYKGNLWCLTIHSVHLINYPLNPKFFHLRIVPVHAFNTPYLNFCPSSDSKTA